ncbi:MAG: response regulator transcription factor [Lachnospiraceae bacterium]|nr:response regulator transcription factor [Lachnospiraceae bacterium]
MKVLVVDDDKFVTLSLKTILESDDDIEVVAMGNNGKDAIRLYNELHPDVLLMDIRMEEMNGLDAAKEIFDTHKDARILFLTTFSDDDYIIKALYLGARGYLIKQDFECIIPSIKAVYSGQSVFGGEIVSKIPTLMQQTETPAASPQINPSLTPKELSIMEQVAKGLNNKEISEVLFLSEGTVRNYISTILEKLDLRDRTQLAIYYLKTVL